MRTVYKYPVTGPRKTLTVPEGAVLRHVAVQDDIPCLWLEVETDNPTKQVTVSGYPTGYHLPEGLYFLGTVLMHRGDLVFHLYSEEPLA